MDKLIEITSLEQYDSVTKEKAIVLFTADWCPDCVFIKPFIGDLVDENPDFKFYVVNRDNFIDLCKDLDILGIPSFIAYNNKEESNRFVSKDRKTKAEIQDFINNA